jgi:hypothetical protein
MPAIDFSVHATSPAAAMAPVKAPGTSDGFGFDDLLDIINPLQHIPVVSTLYKHLTGDKIGVPEKIMGDTLYGGVTGLICSLGDAIFQELTGKSVGDTVYAMVIGDDEPKTTGIASATDNNPVEVKPASAEDIALPDFSFRGLDDEAPAAAASPEVAQRAVNAYRATSKFLSF